MVAGLSTLGLIAPFCSELDALRKELENSQEECRMQKHKLGILQVPPYFSTSIFMFNFQLINMDHSACKSHFKKTKCFISFFYVPACTERCDLQGKVQQFDCLELKQAQHEQFMFELKTQLQKVILFSWDGLF